MDFLTALESIIKVINPTNVDSVIQLVEKLIQLAESIKDEVEKKKSS